MAQFLDVGTLLNLHNFVEAYCQLISSYSQCTLLASRGQFIAFLLQRVSRRIRACITETHLHPKQTLRMETALSSETSATQPKCTLFEPFKQDKHWNDEIWYLNHVDLEWKILHHYVRSFCYRHLTNPQSFAPYKITRTFYASVSLRIVQKFPGMRLWDFIIWLSLKYYGNYLFTFTFLRIIKHAVIPGYENVKRRFIKLLMN